MCKYSKCLNHKKYDREFCSVECTFAFEKEFDSKVIYKSKNVEINHWIGAEGGHFICIQHEVSGRTLPERVILSMPEFRLMAQATIDAIFEIYGENVPSF